MPSSRIVPSASEASKVTSVAVAAYRRVGPSRRLRWVCKLGRFRHPNSTSICVLSKVQCPIGPVPDDCSVDEKSVSSNRSSAGPWLGMSAGASETAPDSETDTPVGVRPSERVRLTAPSTKKWLIQIQRAQSLTSDGVGSYVFP